MSGYSALPPLAPSLDARKASPLTFAKVYLGSSAAAILFLLATVHRLHAAAHPRHPNLLNPYICQPKSSFSSISNLCAHSPQSPAEVRSPSPTSLPRGTDRFPRRSIAQIDKFDLSVDRHLTSAQCDAVFPRLYKSAIHLPHSLYRIHHFPHCYDAFSSIGDGNFDNNNNIVFAATDAIALAHREADRARDYYAARGGVNLTDLDAAEIKGQARAMIYNNRVSPPLRCVPRISTHHFSHRCSSTSSPTRTTNKELARKPLSPPSVRSTSRLCHRPALTMCYDRSSSPHLARTGSRYRIRHSDWRHRNARRGALGTLSESEGRVARSHAR